jgi:hypothetical protein
MTRHEEFVQRFLKEAPDDDDEIQIFLGWLQENGPDEWHRWAISWNWDHGTGLFEWIIAQPNCDRGTALSIYCGAQPDYHSRYASVEEALAESPSGPEVVALMTRICEMWREGAYSTYAYRPSEGAIEYLTQGKDAMLALAATEPWDEPDDLATAGIQGEPNSFDRTIDGVPVEMLRALGENW